MAEPLRKLPMEEDEETRVLEITTGSALPGTPPAFDDEQGRRMLSETSNALGRTGETRETGVSNAVSNISSSVKSGLEVVSERSKEAGAKLAEVAEETRDRAQELALEAGRRAQDLREAAIRQAKRIRRETRRYADQRPLQAILVVAGMGFVTGLALRIWRSNRD
jgi:ElaB/YqjD/DUF883 family membrane-anchored ribosome-binding protein